MKTILQRALECLRSACTTQTIARFGEARLVKQRNGKFELLGGTPEDRARAREWCSLFLHEAAFAYAG